MIADRWGVTDAETRGHYPCDEFVPEPVLAVWRGVTVRTGPEPVWAWVAQLRLAPYSYDWIDNLGRRSPPTLQGLPEPVAGEAFMSTAGRPLGKILSVDPGRQITGTIMGATMSYVSVPIDGSSDTAGAAGQLPSPQTRLLLKLVTAGGRVIAPLLAIGDLVMARRQLLNLAALAEASAAATADGS